MIRFMRLIAPNISTCFSAFGFHSGLVFKMQPSITMFFKAKQPPKVAEDGNGVERKQTTDVKTPQKRPYDDEEQKTEILSESKRVAVEDPKNDSTPVKKEVTPIAGDQTPPKQQIKPTIPCQTPFISLETVIKKKVSNGAYALHENIGHSWFRALQPEFDKPYFKRLSCFIQEQRSKETVYPPADKVYSWTHFHEIRDTRVVILGQDPYHQPNQAHGLCFSVQKGVRIPPSLINIFKELENDISGFKSPNHGNLTGWAKQGVLLLNTCLTVKKDMANSHQSKGWETFTDSVITWISKNLSHNVVFLLWGRPAQRKAQLIDKRHKILTAAHPSPLSAHNGFFGCHHFSQTNSFLQSQKLPEIDWTAL